MCPNVDVIQVKNLSEWKSQLADKNKEIKEENKRSVFRNLHFSYSGSDNDFHTIQPAHSTVTLTLLYFADFKLKLKILNI